MIERPDPPDLTVAEQDSATTFQFLFSASSGRSRLSSLASRLYLNYHLITAEPQVNPAPKATRREVSPSLIRPLLRASSKAMGMEAADVLP